MNAYRLNPELVAFLISKKPDANATTIENFRSSLVLLFKNLTHKTKYDFSMDELNTFTSQQMIDCVLNAKKSDAYIRTMFCAIKAYTGDEDITKLITQTSNIEKEKSKKAEASEYIKLNHLTSEQIDLKYEELKNIAEPLWDASSWDMSDFIKIQNYVMYCLVCGKFIAPRRTSDWTKMKLKNIIHTDNCIREHTFVFKQFKNSKKLPSQIIDIPPELYAILQRWEKFNRLDYLLLTDNLIPMSSSVYCEHLNALMDGPGTHGKSTNTFRHIYLTNKYSNIIDLDKDMENMGSSKNVAHYYIKKI